MEARNAGKETMFLKGLQPYYTLNGFWIVKIQAKIIPAFALRHLAHNCFQCYLKTGFT